MSVARPSPTPSRDRRNGLSASSLMRWYVAAAAVVTAAYYVFPHHELALLMSLGLLSVVALAVGVRIHRPTEPGGWYVLAAAMFCFLMGDATDIILTDVLGKDDPLPSVADALYLLSYPLLTAGLLLLVRRRTATRDRGWILDASIMTTALGLVVWVYLVLPLFDDASLSTMQRGVSVAYPLGDVLLLAVLARLITGGALRNKSAQVLAVGAASLLASDVAFGLAQLQQGWERGGLTDLGWMAFYIAWGAAALHPSMRQINSTAIHPRIDVRFARIAVLALLGMIAPALLLLDTRTNSSAYVASIGVFSAALYLLVLVRLAGFVAVHRQSLTRERVLRVSGESLLIAQDVDDLTAAAMSAVSSLTVTVPHVDAALYLVGSDEVLHVAASSGADLGESESFWAVAVSAGSGSGLQVDGPLSINALRFGRALRGMLVVRARTAMASDVHSALTSLASQVALALESDRLATELHHRQQEVHFWRLRHADGEHRSIEVVSQDISQRQALDERLKHQAFHDGLTNIANRELFQERAVEGLSRIAGTSKLMAMVLLDLDDFKNINDAHGHGVGDSVLCAVAGRLSQAMRPGDTAARLGGDEFAVLVEGVPDQATAEVVVARLLDTFAKPFFVLDLEFYVHASAGLVVAGGAGQDIDLAELLLRADLALDASKAHGKGRFLQYETGLQANMIQASRSRSTTSALATRETRAC